MTTLRLPRTLAVGALLAVVLGTMVAPAGAAAASPHKAGPPVVRTAPCPDDSIFTCITLRVPRDQFATGAGPTVDVTFALHKAKAKTRKGVFVTITGGPGSSGIASADSYTELFDTRIVRDYDIVFIDQRGVGQTLPFQCPNATLAFYTSPYLATLGHASAVAYAHDSKTYTHDCIAESGIDPALLPFFATRQAVEDLDDIRVYLGADKLDLYGESYGTQFGQTYAAAHPTHLKSLMLDGPVDLTQTGTEYYVEDTHAFEDVLTFTLDRCTADATCKKDVVGKNGLAGYDKLAAQLRNGPVAYDFVDASGHVERRTFALGDLETAAAGYVYTEYDRMLLQRAIAWASRGQLLPLARLTYISLGQDPETLGPVIDPTYSDAMYYGVECMDYDYRTAPTAEGSALDYIGIGAAANIDSVRIGSVFYGDMPCAYWPVHPATSARPGFLTSTPFPVFVLTSTTDPATPHANALRIFSHLTDGYLIVQPGGPHVIFGRGNECEDEGITAFLVNGVRPPSRTTTCEFTGTDPYVSIPAAKVKDYKDALAAMTAMDDEINNSADYWNWDGVDPLGFGCTFGGSIEYTAYKDGYKAALDRCAFTAGLPLTGTATIDTTHETFRLKATSPGKTSLDYKRDAGDKRTVTGTYFGKVVSLKG